MIKINDRIADLIKANKRGPHRPSGNWASNLGHPCSRYMVHCRLDWNERLSADPSLQRIFMEGNHQEETVIKVLREAGVKIERPTRSYSWEKYELVGKIDGLILDEKTDENPDGTDIWVPAEIKSVNPTDFQRLNTINDFMTHKRFYVRKWVAQLLAYMLMEGCEYGMILIKSKMAVDIKQINFRLEGAILDYAETLIKRLEVVNGFIQRKEYPDRIDDLSVCERCDFRHVCLPDMAFSSMTIETDSGFLSLLEQREELREFASTYKDVDDQVTEICKVKPAGSYLVGNKFQVVIKTIEATKYDIPPELKKKYEVKYNQTRKNISLLADKVVVNAKAE